MRYAFLILIAAAAFVGFGGYLARCEGPAPRTRPPSAPAVDAQENFLQASAYLSLIQSQKLYYYGYETPPQRPPNTHDAEYHLTGSGGMYLIFELTRAEFPDLFEAKDRLREAASEHQSPGT